MGVFFNIKTCSHRRLSLAPPLSTSLPTPLFPTSPFLERGLFRESPYRDEGGACGCAKAGKPIPKK